MAEPTRLELLQEANNRGLLSGEQKALFDEAQRRGLVGSALGQPSEIAPQISQPQPQTLSEQTFATLGLRGQAPIGDDPFEGARSVAGNLATSSVAGLAGIARNVAEIPKGADPDIGFGKSAANAGLALSGLPQLPESKPDFVAPAAEVVRGVEQAGAELFAPGTPAGQEQAQRIGEGIETVGEPVKFTLSAIPFVFGGKDEQQEFLDVPLGDYLGELATDAGASPLLATLASISPDIALTVLGVRGAKAAKTAAGKPLPQPKTALPTIEELKTQASELYDLIDNSGTSISQESFQGAVTRITDEMAKSGVRAKLTPKTVAALDELAKDAAAGSLTLSKAEELRRVIKQGQKSSDAADVGASTRLLRKWDEFIETLGPKDLIGASNTVETVQYLKSARSLWSRARKTEVVEDLIDRARVSLSQFSQSGFDNALRVQFRSLAKNKKRLRIFTAEEQAAIRKVAMGGKLTNSFRNIGKLAPSGVVSGGFSAGLGFTIAGPAGAFVVPAIGQISKTVAAIRTAKAAEETAKLTRRGPRTRQGPP